MASCRVCGSHDLEPAVDAGRQPISNRFVQKQGESEALFSLRFTLCRDCGIMQLADCIPPDELRPRFDWIIYNEPEEHLDAMVEMLAGLEGINANSAFLGLSFKDDSTMHRLARKGFPKTNRIDPAMVGVKEKGAGIETLQRHVTPAQMRKVAQANGRADMLIVRHVLEHAYDLKAFCDGLKELVTPQGYIVFEVPDCSQAIERLDYTTLWEEHVVYFSPQTLRRCLEEFGFRIEKIMTYPYAFEDSLVCVVRPLPAGVPKKEDVSKSLSEALRFAKEFDNHGKKIRTFLESYRRDKGRIAMFGAGHLACVYINFFGLKGLIEFVADDNPHKKGLFMPGSQLAILGSSALIDQDIRACLLALNPMNEEKVVAGQGTFLTRGGEFLSIFPASQRAMKA